MRDRLSEIVAQTVKFSVLVLHTTQFQFKWLLAVAKAKTHTWVRPAKSFYTRLFELRIDRLNAQTIDWSTDLSWQREREGGGSENVFSYSIHRIGSEETISEIIRSFE